MKTISLKYVARINAGQSPPSAEVADLVAGRPFLQGNAEFGAVHPTARHQCDTAPKVASVGDVLLSVRAPVGALNIADVPYGIGRGLCAVTPEDCDPRFLWWWLHQARPRLDAVSTGTTYRAVTAEDVGALAYPVLSRDEQRRIADFLDVEISRIDRIVFAKEKASARIDERRVSLISQFCLRGLGGDYSLRDSGIDPLGPVPEHWAVTRNKNFMREIVDLSEDGEEELLTVSHLTGVTPRSEKNVFMFKAESMVGYKVCRPGDLVINTLWAWMGALGVSNHEGIVSPAYGVYRFTSQDMVPEYFDLLYRTPEYVCEMTRYSKGVWTSRLRLYPESFLALSAPVPPRDEQAEIVRTVEREVQPGTRLQNAIRRSNALLTERRQALITAAVTGQFDVSTASGRNVTEGITA
ncbi:restriction endonuclease subunit S [Streptomyces sp. NPDC045431]|uniref:restriction endonuclease subunit S n=1 Tax=Streptomyces sp. NPDC045431 TaxID=3155613 RepID=UPI0033E58925